MRILFLFLALFLAFSSFGQVMKLTANGQSVGIAIDDIVVVRAGTPSGSIISYTFTQKRINVTQSMSAVATASCSNLLSMNVYENVSGTEQLVTLLINVKWIARIDPTSAGNAMITLRTTPAVAYRSTATYTTIANQVSACISSGGGGGSPTGSAGGDLSGTYPNPTIAQAGATTGQVLTWDGDSWEPASAAGGAPTGPAGGDLSGTYPNPRIAQNGATSGQALKWSGTAWVPADDREKDRYYSVKTYAQYAGVSNEASFAFLVAYYGGRGGYVLVDTTVNITANTTVSPDVTMVRNGTFNISNTRTLTLNGTFEAPVRQRVFITNTTGTVLFGQKAVTETYIYWFGAVSDGVTDCQPATQKAIDVSIASAVKTVKAFEGIHIFNKGVVIRNGSNTVSLDFIGVKSYTDNPEGTIWVVNDSSTFGIGIQGARAVTVRGIYFRGKNNSYNPTFPQVINNTKAQWAAQYGRSARYSPGCGIVVDPFKSGVTPDGGYPGFTSSYSTVAVSSDIDIENCVMRYFPVGICIAPTTVNGNASEIHISGCVIDRCAYGLTTSNTQSRDIQLTTSSIVSCGTAMDGLTFGNQTGPMPIVDNCQFGSVKDMIRFSSTLGEGNMSNMYNEGIYRIGLWTGAGNVFNLTNTEINFITDTETGIGDAASVFDATQTKLNVVGGSLLYASGRAVEMNCQGIGLSGVRINAPIINQPNNGNFQSRVVYQNCKYEGYLGAYNTTYFDANLQAGDLSQVAGNFVVPGGEVIYYENGSNGLNTAVYKELGRYQKDIDWIESGVSVTVDTTARTATFTTTQPGKYRVGDILTYADITSASTPSGASKSTTLGNVTSIVSTTITCSHVSRGVVSGSYGLYLYEFKRFVPPCIGNIASGSNKVVITSKPASVSVATIWPVGTRVHTNIVDQLFNFGFYTGLYVVSVTADTLYLSGNSSITRTGIEIFGADMRCDYTSYDNTYQSAGGNVGYRSGDRINFKSHAYRSGAVVTTGGFTPVVKMVFKPISGVTGARPTPAAVDAGLQYFNTTTSTTQWWDGTDWQEAGAGGSQSLDNTSDATSHTVTLTGGGGGSFKAAEGVGITITTTGTPLDGIATLKADTAVLATQYDLTQVNNGVFVTGAITGSGTSLLPLDVLASGIDFARIQNFSQMSVLGRASTGVGVSSLISALTDGHILRRSGTTIGFGTIVSTSMSDFTEAAQDAIGAMVGNTLTYTDVTPLLDVKTQMSLTSDASGVKLSGDATSPGNTMLYGTNSSGVKGWYVQPAGAGSGLTSLNGLTAATQTFAVGTAGTDFAISSVTSTHTFNLPTASASNRGALSTADWTTFNSKQAAGNYITALTGDVGATGPGSVAATIAANAVTFAKMQTVAASVILGNDATGTAIEALSGTQATVLLDVFTSSLKGLAPSSGGGTTNFLRADGTWAAPPGGGGGITTLNTLTATTQTFAVGTAGTDFAVSSATSTHTFNLPTASASNRGALSTTDWSAFNAKIGGSGASGQVAYFSGASTQAGSNDHFWVNSTSRLGLLTTTPVSTLANTSTTYGDGTHTNSDKSFVWANPDGDAYAAVIAGTHASWSDGLLVQGRGDKNAGGTLLRVENLDHTNRFMVDGAGGIFFPALGVSNGSLGTISSTGALGRIKGTDTYVPFWTTTGLSEDPNFNWNNTTKRLLVGNNAVGSGLTVQGFGSIISAGFTPTGAAYQTADIQSLPGSSTGVNNFQNTALRVIADLSNSGSATGNTVTTINGRVDIVTPTKVSSIVAASFAASNTSANADQMYGVIARIDENATTGNLIDRVGGLFQCYKNGSTSNFDGHTGVGFQSKVQDISSGGRFNNGTGAIMEVSETINGIGGYFSVANSHHSSNIQVGLEVHNIGSGTAGITSQTGILIEGLLSGSATSTDYFGIKQNTRPDATNEWSYYNSFATMRGYHNGNFGIGTLGSSSKLTVSGGILGDSLLRIVTTDTRNAGWALDNTTASTGRLFTMSSKDNGQMQLTKAGFTGVLTKWIGTAFSHTGFGRFGAGTSTLDGAILAATDSLASAAFIAVEGKRGSTANEAYVQIKTAASGGDAYVLFTPGASNAGYVGADISDASAILMGTGGTPGSNVGIRLASGQVSVPGGTPDSGIELTVNGDVSAKTLRINDSDNTNNITIQPPVTASLTANYTLTLPVDDGTSGQVLSTDGAGLLSWVTGGGGGSTALSGITAATATNTIDNLNFAQVWNWSTIATTNAFNWTANALTTGSIFQIATTNASVNSSLGLLSVANNSASTSGVVAGFVANSGVTGSGMVVKANGTVGIGLTASTAMLHLGGTPNLANGSTNGMFFRADASGITDNTGSGTVAHTAINAFGAPTIAASSSVTYTAASTLYIGGPPAASTNVTITNPYALYVANGLNNFSRTTATTNAAQNIMNLNLSLTTGAVAANFGPAMLFQGTADNAGTPSVLRDMALLKVYWSTATDASRTSNARLQLVNNAGALADYFTFGTGGGSAGLLTIGTSSAVTINAVGITPAQGFSIGGSSAVTLTSSSTSSAGVTISNTNTSSSSIGGISIGGGGVLNQTSGTRNYVSVDYGFAPTSGTAINYSFVATGTFNQTGGASGATGFVYDKRTLTAVANYCSFQTDVNTANAKGFVQTGSSSTNLYSGKSAFGSQTAPTDIVTITGNNRVIAGQQWSDRFADTDGATITMDFNQSNAHSVTLGGNRTIAFSNPKDGARYTIMLKQDGTGSRTVTWPTILWAGGSAPTLTTTAGKTDIITLIYDGTSYYGTASLNF